jgi:divalent metal cation (Fe/Co/Zn/Cd) transporter
VIVTGRRRPLADSYTLLTSDRHQQSPQLSNTVLQTEARVAPIDGLLAAAILIGIALNTSLGWWWSYPPVSALAIVYYGARESRHAWREAG